MPPVEWLTGPVDVFHGTNFVLPPVRRAAGVLTVHDLSYLLDAGPDPAAAGARRARARGFTWAATAAATAEA